MYALTKEFAESLRRVCDEAGALLIYDEVRSFAFHCALVVVCSLCLLLFTIALFALRCKVALVAPVCCGPISALATPRGPTS